MRKRPKNGLSLLERQSNGRVLLLTILVFSPMDASNLVRLR